MRGEGAGGAADVRHGAQAKGLADMAYTRYGRQVFRGQLPRGRDGTRKTLMLMRQLALLGSKALDVREAAVAAVKAAGIRPRDYLGEIVTLFRFVRDRIRYTRDILGVETLQSPSYTLRAGIGDCDDKSTLLAALLRSIGHPAQLHFRAIGIEPNAPDRFRHVYVIAELAGRRLALDPTNQTAGPGWEFPAPTAQMGVAL